MLPVPDPDPQEKGTSDSEGGWPTLLTAIKEQLGLKLVPIRALWRCSW